MSERRPQPRFASLAVLACFATLPVLSCSSDGGGPTTPTITTGTVAVSVSTSGPGAPAAFTAALDDGTPRSVDANGSTNFTAVDGGSHTVTLGDVPDNCTVGGTNPRATTLTAGQTSEVEFGVTCVALTGSLEVTAETTGADLDPDGYEVEIDGGTGLAIGVNATLAPQELTTGDHEVELTGLAANCIVAGSNPRTLTVETDAIVETTFEVTCDATTGAIEVTATTTGSSIDADGYTVDLGGEADQTIDANGSVVFTGVSEGAHSVTLSDIAANCTVSGDNPADATVVIGETEAVAFDLTCTAVNSEPTATISSPDTTSTVAPLYVAPGDAVTFTGAATDPEDGPLSGGSLVWVSNVDGQIGTGETFMTISLSDGQHTVTLTATDSEMSTDTETVLVIVNPPPAAGYQVALRLAEGTTLTPGQTTAIDDAIVKLESIITGDLLDVTIDVGAGACLGVTPVLDETVDDLVIYLTVEPIDGPGGTLGQAGPCAMRAGSFLPALGIMIFDSDDLAVLEADGEVDELLLHEAMHVMGFGTIWDALGLLEDPTGQDDDPPPDTHFSGAAAIAQFDVVSGGLYTGGEVVPVENDNDSFGPGSLNAHWREDVFNHELMTPALNFAPDAPLSVVTVGQFEDLGYAVDYGAADPYIHTFSLQAQGGAPSLDLSNDIWRGPLWVVDPSGNAHRVR